MTDKAAPTLTETLARMGLTHRPAEHQGRREVVDASGAVVVTGSAGEVWAWVHEQEAKR